MRGRAPFVLPTLVFAACAAHPGSDDVKTPTASSVAVAEQREAASATLWPGFDPMSIPLAVFDGQRTWLFRHPSPPEGFVPQEGARPACSAYPGRFPAMTANTSADIGDVTTATLMLSDSGETRSTDDLAAIAIHEAFHVYQRGRHPGWQANEAALFMYPVDDAHLLSLRRLETEALRRALDASDGEGAACFAREALKRRDERFAAMDPDFAAYERGTELNEGLAAYVQARAVGRTTIDIPQKGFDPADVRRRAYATGPALALLLDRFSPGWPSSFEENDTQDLDTALEAALPPDTTGAPPCGFTDAEVARTQQTASADVARLAEIRAGRKAAFETRPGWRVVVKAGDGQPLWPKGFDPLNVERVEGGILHARFLRLGNEAGQLEAIDGPGADIEALTVGYGPHPLFNGIREVVITGLPEPRVEPDGSRVTISAPGLTGGFDDATFTRSGEEVVIRLGAHGALHP